MATLKIYSDIVNEDERLNMMFWGLDGTSFNTVEDFISSIPKEDNKIELLINCRGGDVLEGWSIYDKLRSTGKEISAVIEGKCASIASVILLAAPAEKRSGYQNARLLIHEPYIPYLFKEDGLNSEDLEKIAIDLKKETDKIVSLYVDRTGSDEETLRSLMKEDKYITMQEAKKIGFINEIKQPLSAYEKTITNKKTIMSKQAKTEVKKSFLDKCLKALGFSTLAEAEENLILAMELTTVDGTTLTVEREEGDPQVGDAASPDGEFEMPDGTKIIVSEGVITEIIAPDQGNETVEDLKNKINQLEKELEEARAKAKSKNDIEILNAVAIAGGTKWLEKQCSAYKPANRKRTISKDGEPRKYIAKYNQKNQ